MRLHGDRKHAEIWAFGKAAEAVMAKFDRLRYQLIPYIYSQAKQTYDTGSPFMRALWVDFPKDSKVGNTGDQYMFGPAFLVAPVTEQAQTGTYQRARIGITFGLTRNFPAVKPLKLQRLLIRFLYL